MHDHADHSRPGGEYLWPGAVALLATLMLGATAQAAFGRYFGPVPPVLVVAACMGAGYVLLGPLCRAGWANCHATRRPTGAIVALATLFVIPTVLVDIAAPFAPDMNVALPAALLFYPAIGFVAEILFHLAPLALLLGAATAAGLHPGRAHVFWACAVPVALLEPGFQIADGADAGASLWRDAYLGAHLFAFNLVQLFLLRRHGFLAAYGLRLVYYLWWHIAWGALRLALLP